MSQLLVTVATLIALAVTDPPQQVTYTTERGDVTFDHAKHLARREKCRSCHGDGPVQKIELDKQAAHRLCISCHAIARAGPKACGDCHVEA